MRAARPQPFAAYLEPLAQLFEIAVETARDYLGALSDEDAWHAMMDGIALQHVQGGPATASADVGFVRVAPDLDFPPHVHVGEERNLVLDGSLIDGDGTTYGPGDLFVHPAGSHHVFRSGSRGVLFAVVVWGVDFGADIDIHEDG
jgi:anti-sigma factor ChrR (cupin superfamily)